MPKDNSENWVTSDPKDDDKYPPCPGCGGPVEQNVETRGYVCYDCDNEWEGWELL